MLKEDLVVRSESSTEREDGMEFLRREGIIFRSAMVFFGGVFGTLSA